MTDNAHIVTNPTTKTIPNWLRTRISLCNRSFGRQLIERKPMVRIQAEIDTENELKRTLHWFHLLAIGIGEIIGK